MSMKPHPTVLIVDDESLFLSSVCDALEAAYPDYTVLQASNGQEALDHMDATEVDVLVTDISMPVMDGLELILNLRNKSFAGAMIVVTAFGDAMLKTEVAIRGAFGYLEKPVDLSEMIAMIRSAASGEYGSIDGLDVSNFVSLLALERKSCRLKLTRAGRQGELFFRDGVLVNAVLENLSSKDAAVELVQWGPETHLEVREGTNLESIEEQSSENPPVDAASSGEIRWQPMGGPAAPDTQPLNVEELTMGNVKASLEEAMGIEGAVGVSLVDHESGMSLGQSGGGDKLNLDVASAGNTAVVRAKLKVMKDLGLETGIEDILITLGSQYHLIRPLEKAGNLFLYLALDRDRSNLAMARHKLMAIEKNLSI